MLTEWTELHRAYVSGIDGRVFPTRIEVDEAMMACRRPTSESGKLHVSWPVSGFGSPMVSTSSLREREEPYFLPVELARGKIGQLNDQIGAWELAGMQIPATVKGTARRALQSFAKAASSQGEQTESAQLADEALKLAFEAADELTREYARQRLAVRQRRARQLPASLGCGLGQVVPEGALSDAYQRAFSTATVSMDWKLIEASEGEYHWDLADRQVQWAESSKLLLRGGPILDLSSSGLPVWLEKWKSDFLNLQSFICDYVETVMARYVGRIRVWDISTCGNTGGALGLNEEQMLTLVARTIEVAHRNESEGQFFIRVEQPWGEYQARGSHRLSPLQFVDALLRAGVGLGGVNLEINVGYRPRGSQSRDLLDVSRMIDVWTSLGIPISATLAVPSSSAADPLASTGVSIRKPSYRASWSPELQAEWVDAYLPLLLSKPAVVGIDWAHLSDAVPHELPHTGLVDAQGQFKPALERMTRHLQTNLD